MIRRLTVADDTTAARAAKAAHLQALAQQWRCELARLGRRPTSFGVRASDYAARVAPWVERETAIDGVGAVIAELADPTVLERRAVQRAQRRLVRRYELMLVRDGVA